MKITSIADVDLTDPEVIRECLNHWEIIKDLSYDYPKVRDLKIEIEERWRKADLSESQRQALRINLVEDQTRKATSKRMKTGTRWVTRLVDQGLQKMSEVRFD